MADDLDTYDPVRGSARERVDASELAVPSERATVILDRRRRRPRYFDDRFLTARDLTRGQQYTLLRQADLAQLSGGGIIHGLGVVPEAKGARLRIDPGLGIARTGESIALREPVDVSVAKLRVVAPKTRTTQLVAKDVAAGPGTGLYVLVAHPVEYSRSPAVTYPSAQVSKIALADTEIVEGTWFGLVPLSSAGNKAVVARGRARLAREVFVGDLDPALTTDGLAIAVVGVVNARVQWVDQELVGRHVGADAVVGFGLRARKTRLAYQAQYARQLDEVLQRRRNAGQADGLPATEAFSALPPVGPLPRGAVEVTTTEVRQSFFPREIYVEMAIVPDDELEALLAEGLVRAPIDLEAGPEALEGVPVMIVVPVPRSGFDQLTPRMEGVYRAPAIAATGRYLVKARPIDALTVLRRKNEPDAASDPLPLDLEAWRHAVEMASQLWYVRRGQFATTSVVVPRSAATSEGPEPVETLRNEARERVEEAGEVERFNHLFRGASEVVIEAVNELLMHEFLAAEGASVYVSGMMGELAYFARRPRWARTVEPELIPRSPVFLDIPSGDRLRLRPLELGDIEHLTRRLMAPGVGEALHGPTLVDPFLRSVLATSAVVPELAWWVHSAGEGGEARLATIATLAGAADIAQLRSIAAALELPLVEPEPEPEPEPEIPPVEESKYFPILEEIGESAGLRAIWKPSHPQLRKRVDNLANSEHAGLPVYATATLMQLVTVGFELETRTDKQGVAILEALAKVDEGGEFGAPNGSEGKILSLPRHRPRDAVIVAARKVSSEEAFAAHERLHKAELTPAFGRESAREIELVGEREIERVSELRRVRELRGAGSDIYRLLALASGSFAHITAIASAREDQLVEFIRRAQGAVEARSVVAMRKALLVLGPRRTPRGPIRGPN